MTAADMATALAALQGELPHVPKNRTATVPTKNGGSYSYKYADLNDVASAIHPLLSKHGLSFVALPTITEDGRFVLRYSLRHTDGSTIDGEYPLPEPSQNSAQQIGSALTYARRYVLSAVTGVVPDEDDDGQAAQSAEKPKRAERIRRPSKPVEDEWTAAPGEVPPTPPESRVTDQKWFDGWLERVIRCDSLPVLKGLWSECAEQHRIGKLTNADFEQATDAKNTQKAEIERRAAEKAGGWPEVAPIPQSEPAA